MTLEDETGIANAVVWPKTLERFRKVVMGARLIVIHGRIQRHEDIIHVVSQRLEDLTPLLRRLSEHGPSIEALARCDEVKRPDPGSRSPKKRHEIDRKNLRLHPRRGDALVRMLREEPDPAQEWMDTHQVMPKGRNFH